MTDLISLFKKSYIRQLNDDKFCVYSSGKKIGTYSTIEQATIELNKLNDNSEYINTLRKLAKQYKLSNKVELCNNVLLILAKETGLENTNADLSYSYVMRDLRNNYPDKVTLFMKTFKDTFDAAIDDDLEDADSIALLTAIKKIDYNAE